MDCDAILSEKFPGVEIMEEPYSQATKLAGARSGNLTAYVPTTAQKYKSVAWLCRCDCGKWLLVPSSSFKRRTSCGCRRRKKIIDLTGQRFGRLIALERIVKKGKTYWLCKCDCGKEKRVLLVNLRNGSTHSCGCLSAEKSSRRMKRYNKTHKLPAQEAGLRTLLRRYQHDAQKRVLPFELTKEQFKILTSDKCHYCGAEPSSEIRRKKYTERAPDEPYVYNGIDRIDSQRGYVEGNVVTCCSECNGMKMWIDYDTFVSRVKAICEHLKL